MDTSKFESLDQWLHWQETLHPKSIDLGLERPATVLARLNHPTTSHKVITVAGTNGKGSTVATLESVYLHAGYKVGCYTSPHLIRYNERIRINGAEVADDRLCESFERINRARDEVSLSYFEFGTLAAIDIFNRDNLDIVIYEVGLGGRLDAVNIVDPDIAVITAIDLDHTDWLGETREEIGTEKAGIMRPGTPVVCSDPNPPASIAQSAQNKNALLYQLGKAFSYQRTNDGWTHSTTDLQLPMPSLTGDRQLDNCSGALMAISLLNKCLPVTDAIIVEGISKIVLPGRFQIINQQPLTIVDVAHNYQSANFLAENVASLKKTGKRVAITAMLTDKDQDAVVSALKDQFDSWFLAPLEGERGGGTERLEKCLTELNIEDIHLFQSVTAAYQKAEAELSANDQLIIFGSFYTVSEVLNYINQ